MTEARWVRDNIFERMIIREGPWHIQAITRIRAIPPDTRFTGEELRLRFSHDGLESPAHHNQWGALILTAVQRGMVEKTGDYKQMVTLKSHARSTPVYRRTRSIG